MSSIPPHRRLVAMILLSVILHLGVVLFWWKPLQPSAIRRVTREVRLFKVPRVRPIPQHRNTPTPPPSQTSKTPEPRLTEVRKPPKRRPRIKRKPRVDRMKRRMARRRSQNMPEHPQKPRKFPVAPEPLAKKPTNPSEPLVKKPEMVAKPPTKQPGQKRSWRDLDLRPNHDPAAVSSPDGIRKGQKSRQGSGSPASGKTPEAWAGNDSFGRTMRKYHRDWKEWHHAYSGLTDAFFGTAQLTLDRCLETTIVDNLQKHLSYGEIARLWMGPKWKGRFVFAWDRQGRPSLDLQKSWGYHKLNPVVTQWAKRCLVRISIPKHLRGKRLWILAETEIFAKVRTDISKIVGLEEYRDPQTGGLRWKLVGIGTVSISANTMNLRQRILP